MKLKQVGEFDLIEMMAGVFRRDLPNRPAHGALTSRLSLGIGDDAAAWKIDGDRYTLATTDAMIEGIHFTRETTGWYDLGWKAMASNISDVAGMGGVPAFALAVLGAPGDLDTDDVLKLCQGMADVAEQFGTAIVGGDTVTSPVTLISITLVGTAEPAAASDRPSAGPRVLSRSAAREGDLIAVTGALGSSAGGLELLLGGASASDPRLSPLVDAHRRPLPRVREGQLLVSAGVRCGMDLSDGLAGDLLRICRASNVAVTIDSEALPIAPILRETFGDRAIDLALSGGEDYELVVTAPAIVMDEARRALGGTRTPLTVVGSVTEASPGRPPVLLASRDGTLSPPARSGWEHFTAGSEVERP
ncbi:MAG TPA: thiamine-phosphate kinase [Chloroflexota bacterium]